MKKKYNVLSIIGFVASFFTTIVSFVICMFALDQIDETEEKGSGLAKAGMVIDVLKIILVILAFILFANYNDSSEDVSGAKKCNQAYDCEVNPSNNLYICKYKEDGVEEYINCKAKDIKSEKKEKSSSTTTKVNNTNNQEEYDDEEDTFDYDAETGVEELE